MIGPYKPMPETDTIKKSPLNHHLPVLISLLLFVLSGLLWGCQGASDEAGRRQVVTVFAAASLTDAFSAVGEAFELEHPEIELRFNFAGSQQLAQQLLAGAPADLFASANEEQMALVTGGGRADRSEVVSFTTNQLVVVLPRDNPAGLNTPLDLARPGVKVVLAAAEVPAGRYAQQFFEQAALTEPFPPTFAADVNNNVVSYETNVRLVLTKVALGEADAGVVYRSDAAGSDAVAVIILPEALNPVARYPLVVLEDASHPAAAQLFRDFLLSPAGQTIMTRFGFGDLAPAAAEN